jgi:small subunit ribosomal protein S7
MSRRCSVKVRILKGDFVYNSVIVSKFINYIMRNGKKSVAEGIFYRALQKVKVNLGFTNNKDVLDVFNLALEHVSPKVEVRSRRVGGATYQIPTTISDNRSTAIGIRWIIDCAWERKGLCMSDKLANELIEASDKNSNVGKSVGAGSAVKKREDMHKMAEANKAFSHYRW